MNSSRNWYKTRPGITQKIPIIITISSPTDNSANNRRLESPEPHTHTHTVKIGVSCGQMCSSILRMIGQSIQHRSLPQTSRLDTMELSHAAHGRPPVNTTPHTLFDRLCESYSRKPMSGVPSGYASGTGKSQVDGRRPNKPKVQQ